MSATNCKEYEFLKIEPHWQAVWEKTKAFRAENGSTKPKYYVLDMFPYPSGSGLHIGHPEGYVGWNDLGRQLQRPRLLRGCESDDLAYFLDDTGEHAQEWLGDRAENIHHRDAEKETSEG